MSARTWWLFGVALLIAVGLTLWLYLRTSTLGQRAVIGTGYVAHVVCSCRYLGNRELASCLTDFEPGMEMVRVSDDAGARRITAWVPLISRQTASYSADYGCMLDP